MSLNDLIGIAYFFIAFLFVYCTFLAFNVEKLSKKIDEINQRLTEKK